MWFSLAAAPTIPAPEADCLVAHLGMSGQLLLLPAGTAAGPHLRARVAFADQGPELRFVDQRTFGGLHIARDPLDPLFDDRNWIAAARTRNTSIKRLLLNQSSISGVGNIYADEALWRAQLHGDRPVAAIRPAAYVDLLGQLRAVLTEAVTAGGTSFDSLYVNVNGQSGYFDRSLNAYGRLGQPCRRCGTSIARQRWMNRSSYFCPRCQPPPRARRAQPPQQAP